MKIITFLLLGFGWCGAYAGTTETSVHLGRLPEKAYEVWGNFTVDASTAVVWAVLADYDNIPSFVSSMRVSRVRETRNDGTLLVEQQARGGLFFLKRTVNILLEVRREPESLRFEDVGRESFWRYEGGWKTETVPEGVRVSYHLIAQPDFIAPSMFMNRALKSGARELLDQVRHEIIRRGTQERR